MQCTWRGVSLALAVTLFALAGGSRVAAQTEDDAAPAPEGQPPRPVPPRLVEFVEAEYPEEAAAAELEGTVLLEITVSAEGGVTDVRVVDGVGGGLDEAAMDAARRFRFEPAMVNGQPTAARFRYPYVFELRPPEPEPEPATPEAPPPPAPGRLEGRVIGLEDGAPVATGEVILTAETGEARRAVLNEDGRFTFDGLPPGRYAVLVDADEYGRLEQEEEVAENEVTDVLYRLRITSDEDEPSGGSFGATAYIDPPPREVTRRTIRREELTRIPGTRGDALRAVELLPGVARPPFGAGTLIVRGAAPEDSQVFLDGVPVPLLYHFGGLTSFINSRALERIDFYPGNYSSRYGRKMGGILEVSVRDGTTEDFSGVAEFGVIDTSLLVEGPIGDDFSFLVGARRSLIDVVLTEAVPDDTIDIVAAPVYYDYQAFGTWRPTERDKLRLMFYGSSDKFKVLLDEPFGEDPAVRGNANLATRFHFGQIAWDHQFDGVEQDVDLQVGPLDLDFSLGDAVRFDGRFFQVYGRSEWRARLSDSVRVIAGTDIYFVPLSLDYQGPAPRQSEGNPDNMPLATEDTVYLDIKTRPIRPGFYVDTDLRLTEELRVLMGLRVDYYSEIDELSFDPRLTAFYQLTEQVRLKAGAGIFSQPPEFQESARDIGNPNLEPIRSAHFGGGADWQPLEGVTIGLEGFFKRLWNRVVGAEDGLPPYFVNRGIGRIYGMELSGRIEPVQDRPYFGYLSYTLMRSERKDDPDQDEDWRLFDFDQTHILTLAGVYKLPKNWEVGLTLRIVSGNPTTPIVASVYDVINDVYVPISGGVNSRRNPLFHRLDVRVQKMWIWDAWRLALFLDVQNAYNQKNQEGLIYNYDYSESTSISGLPIIPALGIRGEW